MSIDALTQAKSTLEGVRGALGIYSKTEVDMTLGMLDRAIAKYTDLDAICQDLQEKTYTQAMRIAELEAKLAAAEKQEPVALQMDVIVVNLVREGINKHRARELAEHFIKHAQPKREWVGPTYVVRHICASCGENVGYLGWLFTVTRMPLLKHQCKEKNT
jgi:hypothetical protein